MLSDTDRVAPVETVDSTGDGGIAEVETTVDSEECERFDMRSLSTVFF